MLECLYSFALGPLGAGSERSQKKKKQKQNQMGRLVGGCNEKIKPSPQPPIRWPSLRFVRPLPDFYCFILHE